MDFIEKAREYIREEKCVPTLEDFDNLINDFVSHMHQAGVIIEVTEVTAPAYEHIKEVRLSVKGGPAKGELEYIRIITSETNAESKRKAIIDNIEVDGYLYTGFLKSCSTAIFRLRMDDCLFNYSLRIAAKLEDKS